ncbi:phosphogluconate dehydrogenase (NAD(+)-dependent, decarboxylating) [Rhizohabitans arisaemae]|uniref:phosphogluconate dehydrogenase (NAD(+)-dependent, decarboxylating) n=1 Tax=Rhizohabitans arisaemae TaxID=2720610 RepID=UPI0024B1C164|nr:decarboxylating 6-phosphogluconate dehydrogenase [Rhizohabitans arisaemae]
MQIGMVGLGRMGGNMAERLRRGGHEVVGYDRDPSISDVGTLRELVERLDAPRTVWVMVPAGDPTHATIDELGSLLSSGDTVIDGGNSHYVDDRRHADKLGTQGIEFIDAGVSGGVWGLENGYALMVGGADATVARAMPIFETLKPSGEDGFVHAGSVGAGHFAKMVHNGIEYGMMQSFAEGFELLTASDIVTDVAGTIKSWRTGTVIRSWLLDLMVRALERDPELDDLRGHVQDSGEGRWTVQAAIDHAVPMPVISAALFARFASRQEDSPAMRVVAALRHQFGGHEVSKK